MLTKALSSNMELVALSCPWGVGTTWWNGSLAGGDREEPEPIYPCGSRLRHPPSSFRISLRSLGDISAFKRFAGSRPSLVSLLTSAPACTRALMAPTRPHRQARWSGVLAWVASARKGQAFSGIASKGTTTWWLPRFRPRGNPHSERRSTRARAVVAATRDK